MFKDDRMISVLSGIVLMIAIGTVVQRGDLVLGYLGAGAPAPELKGDSVTAMANDLVRVDVLANDAHIGRDAGARLQVATPPDCGRLFVQDGALQYLPEAGCEGQRRFSYRLAGIDERIVGEVVATVTPAPESLRQDREAPTLEAGTAPRLARTSDESAPVTGPAPSLSEPGSTGAAARGAAAASQPAPQPVPGAPATERATRDGGVAPAASPERVEMASRQPAAGPQPAAEAPGAVPAQIPQQVLAGTPSRQSVPSPAQPRGRAAAADGTGPTLARRQAPEVAPRGARGDLAEPEVTATLSVARIAPSATADRAPSAPRIGNGPERLDAGTPRASLPEIDSGDGDRVARVAPSSGLGPVLSIGSALSSTPVTTTGPQSPAAPAPGGDAGRTAALDPADPAPRPAPATSVAGAGEGGAEDAATAARLPAQTGDEGARTDVAAVDPDRQAIDPDRPAERTGIAIDPDQPAADPGIAIDPDQPAADPGAAIDPDQPAQSVDPDRVAALPGASDDCATPPGLTVAPLPGGRTDMVVVAPCHAGGVAELAYAGLRLAVPLGADGRGQITVPGFAAEHAATLTFPDDSALEVELPFRGLGAVHRVALAWDVPVTLALHAREFGAEIGEAGHVGPSNPRNYAAVHRAGGGFLESHASVDGVGQNVEVYTYLERAGERSGVIEMAVDFVSRHADASPETCGEGRYAAPRLTVLRSRGGEMTRPRSVRLGAVDCARAARRETYLIGDAVGNVIISGR